MTWTLVGGTALVALFLITGWMICASDYGPYEEPRWPGDGE